MSRAVSSAWCGYASGGSTGRWWPWNTSQALALVVNLLTVSSYEIANHVDSYPYGPYANTMNPWNPMSHKKTHVHWVTTYISGNLLCCFPGLLDLCLLRLLRQWFRRMNLICLSHNHSHREMVGITEKLVLIPMCPPSLWTHSKSRGSSTSLTIFFSPCWKDYHRS